MKILHTQNWHLNTPFYGYDRHEEWQHFFVYLLQTITKNQIDTLWIGGLLLGEEEKPNHTIIHLFSTFLQETIFAVPGIQIIICDETSKEDALALANLGFLLRNERIYYLHAQSPFQVLPLRSLDDEQIKVLGLLNANRLHTTELAEILEKYPYKHLPLLNLQSKEQTLEFNSFSHYTLPKPSFASPLCQNFTSTEFGVDLYILEKDLKVTHQAIPYTPLFATKEITFQQPTTSSALLQKLKQEKAMYLHLHFSEIDADITWDKLKPLLQEIGKRLCILTTKQDAEEQQESFSITEETPYTLLKTMYSQTFQKEMPIQFHELTEAINQ